MTGNLTTPGAGRERQPSLRNHRAHYRVDAHAIAGPDELAPERRASEHRRLAALLGFLAPQRGERILDAGCGSGWLASMCASAGSRVWVLDVALKGVAGARQRFRGLHRAVVGDLYELPFAPESMAAVVLSEVAEHLEDIPRALEQVRQVLRPGGRLLISVPYQESIAYHLCIHCNRFTPANAHLHSFGPGDLEALVAACGLRPERTWLLANKVLERLGLPRRVRGWPHRCWRLVDVLANRLLGHAGYVCVLATRAE